MKIDIKKLKGIDLYYYITSDEYPDKDFSEAVSLLMYAQPNKDEALKLLEEVVKKGGICRRHSRWGFVCLIMEKGCFYRQPFLFIHHTCLANFDLFSFGE